MKVNINIAVCVDEAGGIALGGSIPWVKDGKNEYPEDFKHFQKLTKGSVCIMGRKTWEDIIDIAKSKSKKKDIVALPDRECFVLSRDDDYVPSNATKFSGLRAALIEAAEKHQDKEIFVIGGEKLFIEALPIVNTIYMTILKKNYNCNKFFLLDYVQNHFKIEDGTEQDNLYFVTYKRK